MIKLPRQFLSRFFFAPQPQMHIQFFYLISVIVCMLFVPSKNSLPWWVLLHFMSNKNVTCFTLLKIVISLRFVLSRLSLLALRPNFKSYSIYYMCFLKFQSSGSMSPSLSYARGFLFMGKYCPLIKSLTQCVLTNSYYWLFKLFIV